MADTMTFNSAAMAAGVDWRLPPRTAQDYCREMRYFLHKSPDAWCQGVSGRSGGGGPCPPTSPHARAWCLLGLIERFVQAPIMRERVADLLMRAISPACWMPVHVYNDAPGRKVADVVALLDMASKLKGDGVITQEEYIAKTVEHAKATNPWWPVVSPHKSEDDIDDSLSKLVPWPTIMKQIERAVA